MFLSPDNEPYYTDDLNFYEKVKASGLMSELKESEPDPLTWSEKEQKYLVMYNVGAKEGWKLVKPIPYTAAL